MPGGGQVLADVVGADGELAVPAVDEHGQLHHARPPLVAQGVERGAHGPAGVQHVVDEHHERVVDTAGGHGARFERPVRPAPQVVAVERDVERTGGDLHTAELGDAFGEPVRERGAARRDAEQDDVAAVGVQRGLLDDLVRDPGDRARNVTSRQQLPLLGRVRRARLLA